MRTIAEDISWRSLTFVVRSSESKEVDGDDVVAIFVTRSKISGRKFALVMSTFRWDAVDSSKDPVPVLLRSVHATISSGDSMPALLSSLLRVAQVEPGLPSASYFCLKIVQSEMLVLFAAVHPWATMMSIPISFLNSSI